MADIMSTVEHPGWARVEVCAIPVAAVVEALDEASVACDEHVRQDGQADKRS